MIRNSRRAPDAGRRLAETGSTIRFQARLLRPAAAASGNSWMFLVLPRSASAKLPTRAATTVEGTLNGESFKAVLEPDGQKSHWLKVTRKLGEAAGAEAGDLVTVEITPSARELESRVPADLRKALAAKPRARAVWSEITPTARRDWINWIVSAKRVETRERRIKSACDMLASGKRRVCCFDRSGFYGGNFCAPEAAPIRTAKSE
jgi:hypothetical protein